MPKTIFVVCLFEDVILKWPLVFRIVKVFVVVFFFKVFDLLVSYVVCLDTEVSNNCM